MNLIYKRTHSGCGGEVIKNPLAKHFTEEWLCEKCNKTTHDLGCRITKEFVEDTEHVL
jgi:hypothetical protein